MPNNIGTYESHKVGSAAWGVGQGNFKSTSTQCQQSGLSFIPMIMEASGGGWGKQARRVWSELAKKHSLAMGELTSDKDSAVHMLQRLSIILHRENARAILRRSAGAGG